MAHIEIDKHDWWKAKEIPLIETDWRNIRVYCEQSENPFDWERCLYVIRLAPPYALTYGDDAKHNLTSPLLYVGSGNIQQRWSSHREWLYELGHAIPGGRYEVWVCQPRSRNNAAVYADIEADILNYFSAKTNGWLPLRNLRREYSQRSHTYEDGLFDEIIRDDRRYLWAMYPTRGSVVDSYNR